MPLRRRPRRCRQPLALTGSLVFAIALSATFAAVGSVGLAALLLQLIGLAAQ